MGKQLWIGLSVLSLALANNSFIATSYAMGSSQPAQALKATPKEISQEAIQETPQETLQQAIRFRGQWIQGGLVLAYAPPNARITLDDQPIAQAPSGDFIIGFDRDAPERQILTIELGDEVFTKELDIQAKDWSIQRIEGISKKIMNPSTSNQKRSMNESAMVRDARKRLDLDRLDYMMGFQWPLIGRITGDFGRQRVYNGRPGRPHYGVDIAGPVGANVKAPAPGVVTLAHDDMFYSGGTLILDHGLGLSSTFIHLSRIDVKVGDIIEAGQVIAGVGATGRATGPHLDWRMNWLTKRLDPTLQVEPMPVSP